MASPSLAEVEAQWIALVKLLNESDAFARVNPTNWVSLEDTAAQAIESDFAPELLASAGRSRAFLAGLISEGNAASHQFPLLQTYVRHLANRPNLSNAQVMLDAIFDYMVTNSKTCNSRDFVFGTPAAGGGNVGNGTLLRLTKDKYNYDIENQFADAKTAICRKDQNTGAFKHEEEFEFYDQAPGKDQLNYSGGGLSARVKALSARNSLLLNPSLDSFGNTIAAPDDITSWTASVTVNSTNYSFDQTNYYRDFKGATPASLNFKTTSNISQKISLKGTQLDPNIPYLLRVAWNRQVGAGAGTLLIRMGAVNNNVVAAAQTGWQLLYAVASPGQNNWHRQFNEQDMDIVIDWTRTGGELLVDDVLLVPGTQFDGAWYWLLGGSTPFLWNDSFTWTDTDSATVVQRWLHRAFRRYLPHATAAGETWANS